MTRCFISVDLPRGVQKEVEKIQDNLPMFYGKLTKPENLHLTLKFLGEIDEENIEKTKEKLRAIKFPKFKITLGNIGVFSEKFIRIVWLHLNGVEELQKVIDERLKDLFEPERRFMSHLTIARIKKIPNKDNFLEKLRELQIPNVSFIADTFKLKSSLLTSEGPVYNTIEEYSLSEEKQ